MSWLAVVLLCVALIGQRSASRQRAEQFWMAMEVVVTRMNRIHVLHERLYGGEDVRLAEFSESFSEFNDSLFNLRKALVMQ